MIHTAIGYGYQLGGPGCWNLVGFAPGDHLATPWYDETNPLHTFPERALADFLTGGRDVSPRHLRKLERTSVLPYLLEAVFETSPAGWTREASAPPTPSGLLHPSPQAYGLRQRGPDQHVLVASDSVVDVDAEHDQDHAGGDDGPHREGADRRVDWDSLLDAALAELGLRAVGMPDWFWYRSGIPGS